MEKTITRRQVLAGAGVLAAGAMLTGLAGCSGKPDWDGESYLPIGSVVKLKGFEESQLSHVVIARRPKLSTAYSYDDSGNATQTKVDGIYDYGMLRWPFGVMSDFSTGPGKTDVLFISGDQIAEVLFMGYVDDAEKTAEQTLANARSTGENGPDALYDQAVSIVKSVNKGE